MVLLPLRPLWSGVTPAAVNVFWIACAAAVAIGRGAARVQRRSDLLTENAPCGGVGNRAFGVTHLQRVLRCLLLAPAPAPARRLRPCGRASGGEHALRKVLDRLRFGSV